MTAIQLVAPTYTNLDRKADFLDPLAVEKFEESFAQTVGCQYAVAVNSGTSALTVALRVLGLAKVAVRVPTYSCAALLHAAHAVSGRCEFVDTTFDVPTASSTQHDNADVLVHLFGKPTYCRTPVSIEDVTLSLGAVNGLERGTQLGVCSTHESKMISTGQGGVVYGNNPELIQRVRRLTDYQQHPYNGTQQYSMRMSAPQAALGLTQLAQLDEFIERRQATAVYYTHRFNEAGIQCPKMDTGSVFFRYLISVDDPADKIAILADRGIECGRGVNPPLHLQVGMVADFPGATKAHRSLLSVPCHPGAEDLEWVADTVIGVCVT